MINSPLQASSVEILITGGTLDKDYQPLNGELVFPAEGTQSHVVELLRQANLSPESAPKLNFLMQIDSLQMKKKQRLEIALAALHSSAQQLVITHGTDTMVKTANKLLKLMHSTPEFSELNRKTIVLTGAMRPFALGQSDASFNLGAALIAAQTLPPGVYICMNGNIHHGDKVLKDYQQGRFVATA
ncbi:asparaginase [Thiosulfatimonas sediminis]|uniref:Asparaginase n=1 Tax=Thiosulfatimonas sediminis TaxID=2675054 RepID=A0A6F8PV27_9GAMM|nr:asparaginase domain-containing protein [Thiosulfatimonas sediminis]BBP45946.1 asparaginase [Thiosulfatimonas sediminis]